MKFAKLLRHIAEHTDAVVNIDAIHPVFLAADILKLDPDQYVHSGSLCRRMKMEGNFKTCSANKTRSLLIAKKRRMFCGICPYGLWELACPVIYNNELAAVIYLGHFKSAVSDEKKKELLKWGRFAVEFIKTEFDILFSEQPDIFRRRPEMSLAARSLAFIEQQYTRDISISELARLLHVNPNYLSGVIHSATGKTFRQLLVEKRVREAEVYLKLHSKMSVSEIAILCGFNDSNYFSTVFKKITGASPSACRKRRA